MSKISQASVTGSPETLKKFTILLGKNASGKSRFLKQFTTNPNITFHYLTPERSGTLASDINHAQQFTTNPRAFDGEKYKNQVPNFHQLSLSSFVSFLNTSANDLMDVYGEDNIKADQIKERRKQIINTINTLIPEHTIVVNKGGVAFMKEGVPIGADLLSSGTAQVYAIVFDIAHFLLTEAIEPNKYRILLLDEPDAHLHPDLQYTLMGVINEFIKDDEKIRCMIATHSTSILAALNSLNKTNTSVCFVEKDKTEYEIFEIDNILADLVPVFGAHPLTQVFNDYPVLLLEGEDDVFVIQTAIKSSRLPTGDVIKLYPCDCGGVTQITKYEELSKKLLGSIYDNPKIYSLRDRDNNTGELADEAAPIKIIKTYTACQEMENLVLSNEVLISLGSDWATVDTLIRSMGLTNRHTADIKSNVYKIISAIAPGNNKSWEILVGRAIGQNIGSASSLIGVEGSIFNMLGEKATNILLGTV